MFSGTETADRAWIAERVEGYVLKDADLDYLIDLLETLGRRRAEHATLSLGRDVAAVTEARRFVRRTLREWGVDGPLVDDSLVVVSELVPNAIMHADSPCRLRLSIDRSSVRVEVFDDDGKIVWAEFAPTG